MSSHEHAGQSPGSVIVQSLVLAAALLLCGQAAGWAAELRLRSQCVCTGPLVTLGDVAEIIAADAKQGETLAAIELFPAPAASRQRYVRLREIQDLLALRGVDLAAHCFSGSSQVTVLAPAAEQPTRPEPSPPALSPATAKRAERRLCEAIGEYLRQQASADQPWIVEVTLSAEHARLMSNAGQKVSISGGVPPWSGRQQFEVRLDTPDQPARFTVEAQVAVPPEVVVATRALARGVLIRETDVELQRDVPRDGATDLFYSLDEVLGKETARAVPAGKPLQHESLRTPLLVRRGEVVTVYARSSGIRVRTLGRARDDGSLGDLIAVESLQDRTTYFARVSEVREVEVFAHSPRADSEAMDKLLQATAGKPTTIR